MSFSPMEKSSRALRRANFLSVLLFVIGLIQMLGYIIDSTLLRGIGAASVLAPLPKVFSDVDGLETFASDFTLLFETINGETKSVPVTPELYSRLEGPYKRRNVYGAALSYAPRLPEALWQPVFAYGFAGPLLDELELPRDFSDVSVVIKTKTEGRDDSWRLHAPRSVVSSE